MIRLVGRKRLYPVVLSLTLCLMAMAVASCMSSEMPAAKPTPNVSTSTPTLSATSEADVQYTCETVMTTPYDSVMTGRGEDGSASVGESYFSGRDSRHVATHTNSRGEVTGRSDHIIKDGVLYTRSSESDDNPMTWTPWFSHGDGFDTYHFPCFSLRDATSDAATGEYHIVKDIFLSEEEGTEKREFWADSTGKPLRGRRTFTIPATPSESGASGQTPTTFVVDVVYSGFGEPNVITAPIPTPAS